MGPRQKKEVSITFESDEAKVIIATILVKIGEGSTEVTKILKVSAIGKYPFITLDAKDIDFGTRFREREKTRTKSEAGFFVKHLMNKYRERPL